MSVNFDREEIQRLANLARLELSSAEADTLAEEMAEIVAYVDKLQEVDTSKVELAKDKIIDLAAAADDVVQPWNGLPVVEADRTEQGMIKVQQIFNRDES